MPPILCVVALFLFPGFVAKADPLSGDMVDDFLKELDDIEEVVNGNRIANRTTAVEMFQAAAASDKSAVDFYLKCVKMLRFDSRDAKFSEYRDWREKNEDRLKNDSYILALRLQLQYLVLTLRVAEGVDREAIIPELEQFVTNIVANVEQLEGAGWQTLREPVNRTAFAEAFELNQSLEVSEWHYSPGEFAKVYEQTIFPFIRNQAPAELPATWDRRIQLETKLLELTQPDNELALEKFSEERLPRLRWEQAEDVFVHTSESGGATAMMQLLRQHSDHPDATKWLKSARELINLAKSGSSRITTTSDSEE